MCPIRETVLLKLIYSDERNKQLSVCCLHCLCWMLDHFYFCQVIYRLHGPPMSVDKTDFGLVLYHHANFNRFEETSSYWSVKQISVFLCFSLVNQRHTSCITVYNRTVTNIENTVRAVHSCNSWLFARSSPSSRHDITSEAMNDM